MLILGFVVVYVLSRAWPTFKASGLSYFGNQDNPGLHRELSYASAGHPAGVPYRELHAWPAIYGTLLTAGGAILVGLPFSLLASIFVAELAPDWLARLIEPLIRVMAAVPSVVWGLFGLLVLAPFIERVLISDNLRTQYAPVVPLRGENILLGILVLTAMTVPFQIAIFTDALRAVPVAWREGGRALGLDAWRATVKISLPVIRPAIATGVVLASGRAIGEGDRALDDDRRGCISFPIRSTASSSSSSLPIPSRACSSTTPPRASTNTTSPPTSSPSPL